MAVVKIRHPKDGDYLLDGDTECHYTAFTKEGAKSYVCHTIDENAHWMGLDRQNLEGYIYPISDAQARETAEDIQPS